MLSKEAREQEIKNNKLMARKLTAQIAAAPAGVDTSELREQLKKCNAKLRGRKSRAISCSREELADSICKFFDSRQVAVVDDDGNVLGYQQTAPITVTALANWLGIDRKTLVQYANGSDEYGDIITAARSRIEELYEGRLVYGENNPAGVIFALKNLGWSDEVKMLVGDDGQRRMTNEEIQEMIEADIVTD